MVTKTTIQKLLRRNVAQLSAYSSARDEFSDKADIWLDANESPFENGINRYPDPRQRELKKAIARLKKVKKEHVFIGNGSDEVLDLLYRAFCEPRLDNVIVTAPSYGMYEVLAEINDVDCRRANLNADFSLNTDNILVKTDENTKLIFICSPNNPTGNTFDVGAIELLLENTKALVVLDEAYIDFSEKPGFLGKLLQYPGLVIVQTLSKAWGMAGIRLGLGFASEEIINVLDRIKPPYNINLLSQQQALTRIENRKEVIEQIEVIRKEKQKMKEALQQLPGVKKVFPSDTNFLLVEMKNATAIYTKLLAKDIVVRNRSGILHCNECLRITIGTPEENRRLLTELKKIVQ